MSDIVERLRRRMNKPDGTKRRPSPRELEAADEITRLRAEIATLKASIADKREDAARAMREACAKVAESKRVADFGGSNTVYNVACQNIAAAIRDGVDRYQRRLCRVTVSGRDLGDDLVRRGYAVTREDWR